MAFSRVGGMMRKRVVVGAVSFTCGQGSKAKNIMKEVVVDGVRGLGRG
jgi:hypothetical protein